MEYLRDAEEFAKAAKTMDSPTVVIQNAFKATEFALKAYASELNRRIDSHADAKRVAYSISDKIGMAFTELLDLYHGSYRREDGDKAGRAIKLMEGIIDGVGSRLTK